MDRYGFGRAELLPIRSYAGGIARYVGKYLEKGSQFRGEQFKGARMVRYSRGLPSATISLGSSRGWSGASSLPSLPPLALREHGRPPQAVGVLLGLQTPFHPPSLPRRNRLGNRRYACFQSISRAGLALNGLCQCCAHLKY